MQQNILGYVQTRRGSNQIKVLLKIWACFDIVNSRRSRTWGTLGQNDPK